MLDQEKMEGVVERLKGTKPSEGETLADAVHGVFNKEELALAVQHLSKRKARKPKQVSVRAAIEACLQLEDHTSDPVARWSDDGILRVVNEVLFPHKERQTTAPCIAWYRNDNKKKSLEQHGTKDNWQDVMGDKIGAVQALIDSDDSTDVSQAFSASGYDSVQALLEAIFAEDQEAKATKRAAKEAERAAKAEEKKRKAAEAKAAAEAADTGDAGEAGDDDFDEDDENLLDD